MQRLSLTGMEKESSRRQPDAFHTFAKQGWLQLLGGSNTIVQTWIDSVFCELLSSAWCHAQWMETVSIVLAKRTDFLHKTTQKRSKEERENAELGNGKFIFLSSPSLHRQPFLTSRRAVKGFGSGFWILFFVCSTPCVVFVSLVVVPSFDWVYKDERTATRSHHFKELWIFQTNRIFS